MNWLTAQLDAAVKDDPEKPIFVCQHHSPQNTIYGSQAYGHDYLTNIFKKYPQVINFSGHTHFPISDPRSIHQRDFTALATGTIYYYEMGLNGVQNQGIYPTDREGGYNNSTRVYEGCGEYYIVEVDANGAVLIKLFSCFANGEVGHYYIPTPWDKTSFTYTDARVKNSPKPEFSDVAELKTDKITETSVKVIIPQATVSDGVVESYKIVALKDGEVVRRAYALSDYFYQPTPEFVSATVMGLDSDTEYKINVYAVNAYGVQSEKFLSTTVKTAPESLGEKAPAPNVFSAEFSDGKAVDAVSGTLLAPLGNPQTKKADGKYVGVFDGSSGYSFDKISNYYDMLKNSFTIEAYFKLKQFSGDYIDVFSNQESGGMGIEVTKEGRLTLSSHIKGGYIFTGGDIVYDEYIHFVATYDGTNVKAYINGKLVDIQECSGGLNWTDVNGAKYLVVGGDSGANGGAQSGMTGEIAVANIYSKPLTDAQVKGAYEAAKKN